MHPSPTRNLASTLNRMGGGLVMKLRLHESLAHKLCPLSLVGRDGRDLLMNGTLRRGRLSKYHLRNGPCKNASYIVLCHMQYEVRKATNVFTYRARFHRPIQSTIPTNSRNSGPRDQTPQLFHNNLTSGDQAQIKALSPSGRARSPMKALDRVMRDRDKMAPILPAVSR